MVNPKGGKKVDSETIHIEFHKLRKQGISYAAIGRNLGFSRQAVYDVVERRFANDRIMSAIAETIGKDKADVFPEYFKKESLTSQAVD